MKSNHFVSALLAVVVLFSAQAAAQMIKKTKNELKAQTQICEVDATAAPELAEFVKQLPALCEKNYPKIKNILASKSFEPPAKVKLIFRQQQNPGEAVGDTVYLSIEWFKKYPQDLGAIVHELAHVVQSYPQNGTQPFWLKEGIADFVRYATGYQNSWSNPRCGGVYPRYDSGYWCSAAFLGFVEKRYKSKNPAAAVNEKLRANSYTDAVFKDVTGKEISELWRDCLLADCNGGTP
ncbi:MAG TPA: basic secretory protein-like protein [Pyrinomonadaceae bacterium]|jgi:hypothetical protein